MEYPKVTIAVLSWNRLHYLRATMESARRCIKYPNIEWIVSDNESEEPGLREYIQSLDWVDRKIFKKQGHAEAMNQIVGMASGEFLLLWPEDIQFIVEGEWLVDMIEIMTQHRNIGSVGLDAVRQTTLAKLFAGSIFSDVERLLREAYWYRMAFRKSQTYSSARGVKMRTAGYRWPGIAGAGIPSLTRLDVWRSLGPWKTKAAGQTKLIDSSMGAEEYMYNRFHDSRLPLQIGLPLVPVAADIVTDPLGTKAKVRGTKRYGVYMPPAAGTFYYEICKEAVMPVPGNVPLSFMEVTKPLGFAIPVDEEGDRKKYGLNEAVVFDIATNHEIDPT